jgi:hypothetical protein
MEFKFLLVVKIIYLIGRTGLFKTNNFVLGGETIVTPLHSSLESVIERGEREREDQ